MKAPGLGGWWFAYGIFRITMAVLLVVFNSTAHLMFGSLLTRVPRPLPIMYSFEVAYWIVIAWCVVCAILSILAAGMLFVESRPAAKLARIAAFVSLPEIPFGLVLGVYTLLRLQGERSGN
ncbi:MAG: hypothetical protein ACRD8A_19070 [Candidatus Acidiferrales bacterium]